MKQKPKHIAYKRHPTPQKIKSEVSGAYPYNILYRNDMEIFLGAKL